MAPEHEEPRIGWYNRFARHPYYGKTGVNSGVMLMNMTRLREKTFKVITDIFFFGLYFEIFKQLLSMVTICDVKTNCTLNMMEMVT